MTDREKVATGINHLRMGIERRRYQIRDLLAEIRGIQEAIRTITDELDAPDDF